MYLKNMMKGGPPTSLKRGTESSRKIVTNKKVFPRICTVTITKNMLFGCFIDRLYLL
jgi:hypothetical protein